FGDADARLTTQMKSVGQVMAIGRNFQESLQKALRGLEVGSCGFESKIDWEDPANAVTIRHNLTTPGADRLWYVGDAFRSGMSLEEVFAASKIDPWFLVQIEDLIKEEQTLLGAGLDALNAERLYSLKRKGFSDKRLGLLLGVGEKAVRHHRQNLGIRPVYKRVDTCAAEFATDTAYMYSTYDEECEAAPSGRDKIMVLGGGPNRIGQGIEFDYCCVHAALAAREDGFETIMVNCNPETVSTDYDTSDRLYFEPVTLEDVLEIVHKEKPKGVIVQFGGQTPLKLARALEAEGVPIIGTSPESIDRAEDRERFQQMIEKLGLKQPANAIVRSLEEAVSVADSVGYPLVVRPSYVLGGRAMEIVYSEKEL
ncbi:MAG TPA: carbamoyl phosphate synthase large subunit, partial [Cellvibrionaceae bacterium]|nr:carbamoyl phosphate synthase large subunit [Cellvibrionaceae bacterium]